MPTIPFTIIRNQVEAALTAFADLTALHVEIRTLTRDVDIRHWFNPTTLTPVIWVVPGRSLESPFSTAQSDDSTRSFEIMVYVPGGNASRLEAIEWQIKRAMALYCEHKDAAGDPLPNPSPLNQMKATLSDFAAGFREIEGASPTRIMLSIAQLRVWVGGERQAITGDTPEAPIVRSCSILVNGASAFALLTFDQQMESMIDGEGSMTIRDGTGSSWDSTGPLMAVGGRGMFELSGPNVSAGAAAYTYTQPAPGPDRFTGNNGEALEDVVLQSLAVTIIE